MAGERTPGMPELIGVGCAAPHRPGPVPPWPGAEAAAWQSPHPLPLGCPAVVDILLDGELLAALCRRSRRRLRDLQANCQAAVRLDRARSVLRVCGHEDALRAVRQQLAGLSGPRRTVPSAVWAELMRTRTMLSGPHAHVSRLQERSGCRVHIERSRREVHLFGAGAGVAVADELLQELVGRCCEEDVDVDDPASLSAHALQVLAYACDVTFRIEGPGIVVMGLKPEVARGAAELRKYLADPPGHPLPEVPPEALQGPQGVPPSAAEQRPAARGPGPRRRPPPEDAAHPSGPSHAGRACDSTCPTCGAGRFCTFCGSLVWVVGAPSSPVLWQTPGQQPPSMPGSPANAAPGGGPCGTVQAWLPQVHLAHYGGVLQQTQQHQQQLGATQMQQASLVPVCLPSTALPSGTAPGHTGLSVVQAYMVSGQQTAMVPACLLEQVLGAVNFHELSNSCAIGG